MSLDNADSNGIEDILDINDNQDDTDQTDLNTDDSDDDEFDFSIEGEEDSQTSENQQDSSVIRQLRNQIKQYKDQLKSIPASNIQQEQEIVLGEKPTLEAFDYDTDKYEAALADWHDTKIKIANQEKAKEAKQQELQNQQRKEMENYEKQRDALKVKNFEAVQNSFVSNISKEQGAIILKASNNKALMVYTLGSRPDLLDKLSDISDPFKLAAEVGKLESKIKMNKKASAPKPEAQVRGRVASSATETSDKTLAKLEKEAAQTGDRSKVIAYKKSLRNK